MNEKSVRCKFRLSEVTEHSSTKGKSLVFRPEYDPALPEDQRFAKASPSGEFKIFVDNPSALEFFKVGEQYYFDATKVPTEPAAG